MTAGVTVHYATFCVTLLLINTCTSIDEISVDLHGIVTQSRARRAHISDTFISAEIDVVHMSVTL